MISKTNVIIIIKVILILLAIFFLYSYIAGFMPIILAFLTALAFEPLIKLMQERLNWQKRLPAVAVVFISYVILLSTILYLAVAKLLQQLIRLIQQLPEHISTVLKINDYLANEINRLISDFPQKELIIREIDKQGDILINKTSALATDAIPFITSSIQAIPGALIIAIVYLITVFMFSLDLPNIKEKFYNLFASETSEKIRYIFKRIGNVVAGFFKAQLLVSIVIFVVSYIGLLFIAPERALLMAVIIWIIDVIPFIGSILILMPWIIYSIIAGNTATAIKLLILQIVLLAVRRTLEPKIMGNHIGLTVLPTLLSMYFGIYFLGVIGLVFGPLIFITIKSALEANIFNFDIKKNPQ